MFRLHFVGFVCWLLRAAPPEEELAGNRVNSVARCPKCHFRLYRLLPAFPAFYVPWPWNLMDFCYSLA